MKVYYDTAALERLLNEAVRAQVPALPRHWLNIGFDGSAMLISWWGGGSRSRHVERAIPIAEASLKLLGECLPTEQTRQQSKRLRRSRHGIGNDVPNEVRTREGCCARRRNTWTRGARPRGTRWPPRTSERRRNQEHGERQVL
jgi:hypothetical protein